MTFIRLGLLSLMSFSALSLETTQFSAVSQFVADCKNKGSEVIQESGYYALETGFVCGELTCRQTEVKENKAVSFCISREDYLQQIEALMPKEKISCYSSLEKKYSAKNGLLKQEESHKNSGLIVGTGFMLFGPGMAYVGNVTKNKYSDFYNALGGFIFTLGAFMDIAALSDYDKNTRKILSENKDLIDLNALGFYLLYIYGNAYEKTDLPPAEIYNEATFAADKLIKQIRKDDALSSELAILDRALEYFRASKCDPSIRNINDLAKKISAVTTTEAAPISSQYEGERSAGKSIEKQPADRNSSSSKEAVAQ